MISEKDFELGGIYTGIYDGKRYATFKVIHEDDMGVHLAIYNYFSDRFVDYGKHKNEYVFSEKEILIAHLPVLKESFKGINPNFCFTLPINEIEFEGYRYWENDNGGYWNDAFKEFMMSVISFD